MKALSADCATSFWRSNSVEYESIICRLRHKCELHVVDFIVSSADANAIQRHVRGHVDQDLVPVDSIGLFRLEFYKILLCNAAFINYG